MKQYLGDGVYIQDSHYGNGLKITTEDGISETNVIHLETEVVESLIKFLQEWWKEDIL